MTRQSDFHNDDEDEFADHESENESLSPTDGYFNHREHPQEVYVHTSPTTSTTTHSKELEAAGQSQASSSTPRSSANYEHDTSTASTTQASTVYTPLLSVRSSPDETSPLLRPPSLYDAPPPAYSVDQVTYSTNRTSYSSIQNSQRPFLEARTTPLFPGVEPESMGNPSIEFDTEQNLYRRPPKKRLSLLCFNVLTTVAIFLAIICLIWFWLWAMAFSRGSNGQKGNNGHSVCIDYASWNANN